MAQRAGLEHSVKPVRELVLGRRGGKKSFELIIWGKKIVKNEEKTAVGAH